MTDELQIRLATIDKLLEKSEYFWVQHILTLQKKHYIEAEMWEKKHIFNSRILQKVIKNTLNKEEIWR